MGSRSNAGFTSSVRGGTQVKENLGNLTDHYKVGVDGRFGSPKERKRKRKDSDSNYVRNIVGKSAKKEARKFWKLITKGATISENPKGVFRARFEDGSYMVLRMKTKSPKSPAIEIFLTTTRPGIQSKQKIHFVKISKEGA